MSVDMIGTQIETGGEGGVAGGGGPAAEVEGGTEDVTAPFDNPFGAAGRDWRRLCIILKVAVVSACLRQTKRASVVVAERGDSDSRAVDADRNGFSGLVGRLRSWLASDALSDIIFFPCW